MTLKLNTIFVLSLLVGNAVANASNSDLALETSDNYWQLGVGLSYTRLPHYLGSNESKNYLIPFPHIVVKTKYLSVDRSVIKGHLLSSDTFKFDISFGGSFKVDSSDNELRQGMPDLDYILETGPSLNWLISGRFDSKRNIAFELPVRAAIATDFSGVDFIGWRIVPTVHWKNKWGDKNYWQIDNKLRLLYATEKYHDYLYSVDDEFIVPGRAGYKAEKGYGGWQYKFDLKYKKDNLLYGFFATYSNIVQANYRDSSLVVENTDLTLGVFVSWAIWGGVF